MYSMKVKDIMSRDIIYIHPDDSVKEVFQTMLHYDTPCLPVIDKDNNLIGFILEEHLLERVKLYKHIKPHEEHTVHLDHHHFIKEQRKLYGEKAKDLMETEIVAVNENTPITEVIELMLSKKVAQAPVMRKDKLVGFLTRQDVLKALFYLEEGRKMVELPLTDAEISYRVFSALKRNLDVEVMNLKVETYQGVVHLYGAASSSEDLKAAEDIAKSIPGVKSVSNALIMERML